jgi:hypothetical protein
MRIDRVMADAVVVPLRRPVRTASGTVDRHLLAVTPTDRLTD